MEVKVRTEGGHKIIEAIGRIDTITASDFEAKASAGLADAEQNVLLDLRNLEYISSAGLRSLLLLGKKVRKAGGQMTICVAPGLVRDVLVTANFDGLFPLNDKLEPAVRP